MPNIDDLEEALSRHFASPQKSERWAMYRLINPVVDFANSKMGLEGYFEFNQTSTHGTSQSVDIALLDDGVPVVLIEAKRAVRRISAEQIGKYLSDDVRGIVSNGYNWILCLEGESKQLSIWDEAKGKCIRESLTEITDFIQTGKSEGSEWCTSSSYMPPSVKPSKPSKQIKATRKNKLVTVADSVEHCQPLISGHPKATVLEVAFLESMIASVQNSMKRIPTNCRVEFRESRVSFFNDELPGRSKRAGRIELGKKQPDILVLTSLVEEYGHISKIATPEPADKGPHMRRFRLSSIEQANLFGTSLGSFIFEVTSG
jgi:hypothetical protein